MHELFSDHSLAVDHQQKVGKRTLGGEVVGGGGQTFTIQSMWRFWYGVWCLFKSLIQLSHG